MTLYLHDGTQFQECTDVWMHDGSEFRQLTSVWMHDGTQFRLVYTSTTSEFLRPSSDIGLNGTWSKSTGTTFWELLDEETPSTTDYAYTTTAGRALTVGLSSPSGTPTGTGIVLRVGWQITTIGGGDLGIVGDQKAELLEGTTVLQTFTSVATEADNAVTATITDYTTLRVRVTSDTGIADDRFEVYWIELEVPT